MIKFVVYKDNETNELWVTTQKNIDNGDFTVYEHYEKIFDKEDSCVNIYLDTDQIVYNVC